MTVDLSTLAFPNLTLEEVDSGVLIVTLARSTKGNALDAETIEALVGLFSILPRSNARSVVLAA